MFSDDGAHDELMMQLLFVTLESKGLILGTDCILRQTVETFDFVFWHDHASWHPTVMSCLGPSTFSCT
jgi:hypothetical protein